MEMGVHAVSALTTTRALKILRYTGRPAATPGSFHYWRGIMAETEPEFMPGHPAMLYVSTDLPVN